MTGLTVTTSRDIVASAEPLFDAGSIRQAQSAMKLVLFVVAPLALSGCLAKTALDVVTLPVRAVGAGVDVLTTSQSEADRNRGRALRKHEEREAEERRREDKRQRKLERQARDDRD